MNRIGRLAALLAVGVLTGCIDLLPPEDEDGAFTVTVGSGTQPSYSWPGGPALRLDVVEVSEPFIVVWGLVDPSHQNIASPAKHGTVPAGTLELTDAERTLRSGVLYRVTVTLANSQRGWQEFRP